MQEYTLADQLLTRAVQFQLADPDLTRPVVHMFNRVRQNGSIIPFQFPPRMVADSRRGEWVEREQQGREPVAEFKKSGAREMTLSWTYIVDGGQWTTTEIASIVHTLRGYFAQIRRGNTSSHLYVVTLIMWLHAVPAREDFMDPNHVSTARTTRMSARIKSVDIKHGHETDPNQ